MATNSPNSTQSSIDNRVIAFFTNQEEAYEAVADLKDAGFTSSEIGVIARGEEVADADVNPVAKTSSSGTHAAGQQGNNESLWEKIKNFFEGDSTTGDSYGQVDYRDTSAGLNWDQNRGDYYYRGIGEGGALVTVTGSRLQEAREILEEAGGDLRESGFESLETEGAGRERVGESAGSDEDYRIQLRGEVLRTFRERVQRGEVRLRKEVITENQTVEVPVTREELVIERVPVSGQQAGDTSDFGSGKEVRVQLSEERTRVEKQPVVTEEVRVGKRQVQNKETVSENVRHEELRVDKDGNVDVDTTGRKGKKPAA